MNAANNFSGATPLHYAVRSNRVNVVAFLLTLEEIDVNAATNLGDTPLHWASGLRRVKVIKVLLTAKEIDVKATNNNGVAALHWKPRDGNFDAVLWMS